MDRLTGWVAKAALVFLYVPIVAVVVYSFNASETSSRWGGFSVKWYGEVFTDRALLKTLQTSFTVGAIAAAVATTVGFLTAFGLARYRVKGRTLFLGAVLLPLVLPEIVLGAALLTVFSTVQLPLGIPTIVLGHIVISLPLTTLILMGAISSLDSSLSEASADLGCTPWQTFIRVLFPLLRSSIFAAFLLAFTTSFSNIVISTFTSGVGSTTLPLRIYSLLKTGITPEINALGAMLIVATVLLIFAVGIRQMRRILVGYENAGQSS
ncbi:ABC transporter permease [Mycolicibacterium wolinskyi]|uniref:ABC transporter permease n=1 Tax=Mycolicibacterium TaxID=1866885 RepID=UPI000DA23ADE|nr:MULTISPECIES: ABC transporter permease [Mycolicibacterium]MCV7288465.1 ABC transporter permease [Mycolicibacterium wolinskyi]MCV7295687.1 ABC transporter permease [Mycolicibacterium goodii]